MNLKKRSPLVFGLLLAGCLCASLPATGKTFFVAKDGSGDYTVIQAAVNAAASGDTIRIGPGRYDDRTWVTCPGWSEWVGVLVTQRELTLIGAGYPETIIGPEEHWTQEQGSPKGLVSADGFGSLMVRVEGVWFQNWREGIYSSYESEDGSDIKVSNCHFSWNYDSLGLSGQNGTVEVSNCVFGGSLNNVGQIGIAAWGQVGFTVSHSVFYMANTPYSQSGIALMYVNNAVISDCEFNGGYIAISSSTGSPLAINDCLFDGQMNTGVAPQTLSVIELRGCIFKNQRNAIRSLVWSNNVSMFDCVIESVSECSFDIIDCGPLVVRNCDLAKGNLGVVRVYDLFSCSNTGILDLRNNYWGTDNPDSIRAWIQDSEDSDQACYTVDFEPFLTHSTPTEKKSLGGIRSLYR